MDTVSFRIQLKEKHLVKTLSKESFLWYVFDSLKEDSHSTTKCIFFLLSLTLKSSVKEQVILNSQFY